MTEKLKPCPFCGGKAELFGTEETKIFYVECLECDADSNFDTPEEAIVEWNNRAYEDKLREDLKKVMYVMSLLPDDIEHNAKGILAHVVHELWPKEQEVTNG